MAATLEFFFDYGSPFSYLADARVGAVADRVGARLEYQPMLLGAVLKATGNASPAAVPAKGRYSKIELARWSALYRTPFRMNPFFPINTMRLMRGAVAAQEQGVFASYHAAIFPAVWAKGLNLGDPAVVREVIGKAGLDVDRILAATEEQPIKDKLRANTDEAVRRGVFGAPTFFVGEQMFWGNDRLDFVERALQQAGNP